MLNRLGVDHKCDRQTERRRDEQTETKAWWRCQ